MMIFLWNFSTGRLLCFYLGIQLILLPWVNAFDAKLSIGIRSPSGGIFGKEISFDGASTVSTYRRNFASVRMTSTAKFRDFDQVLHAYSKQTLLVYFGTSKCGPCRIMKKELGQAQKLISEQQHQEQHHHHQDSSHHSHDDATDSESVKVFYLDTEKWPHLGTRFGIQRLPCILFVRDGDIQKRLEGVTSAEVLAEEFRMLR